MKKVLFVMMLGLMFGQTDIPFISNVNNEYITIDFPNSGSVDAHIEAYIGIPNYIGNLGLNVIDDCEDLNNSQCETYLYCEWSDDECNFNGGSLESIDYIPYWFLDEFENNYSNYDFYYISIFASSSFNLLWDYNEQYSGEIVLMNYSLTYYDGDTISENNYDQDCYIELQYDYNCIIQNFSYYWVGSNSQDCNGVEDGEAFMDDCGVCSGGNTGNIPNSDMDCSGLCFGDSIIDECGECNGNNQSMDDCGMCFGDNSFCTGCTYDEADNYIPENIFEDGSCIFPECNIGDINNDGDINVIDVVSLVDLILNNF